MTTINQADLTELFERGELPNDPIAASSVVADAPALVGLRDAVESAFADTCMLPSERAKLFMPTGIKAVDTRYGIGLERGTCTVIGGHTSTGKSTFALGLLDTCVRGGDVALIVSLEDGFKLFGRRLLSMRTGIRAKTLREGGLSATQLDTCSTAIHELEDVPFFLNARGWSVEKICKALRWAVKYYGVKLVVIDYLQKLRTDEKKANRTAELEHAANYLSDTMCNLGLVGLLLSQLSGSSAEVPSSDNIRDCKSIGNAAENIMLLWRNKCGEDIDLSRAGYRGVVVPQGATVLLCTKMKDGGDVGAELLHFDTSSQRYIDPPGEHDYLTEDFDRGFDDGLF